MVKANSKALIATEHPGPALCLAYVAKKMMADSTIQMIVGGRDKAVDVFNKHSLPCISFGANASLDVDPSRVSADEILAAYAPDIILTATGQPPALLDKELVAASKRKKIPVIAVTDLWGANQNRFYGHDGMPFIPDKVTAIDAVHKEELLRVGIPEQSIVLTGQPSWSTLYAQRDDFERRRATLRSNYGMDEQTVFILYPSHPNNSLEENGFATRDIDVVDALTLAMHSLTQTSGKRYLLTVRPHPRERMHEKFRDIAALCSQRGVGLLDLQGIHQENVLDIASAADYVAGVFSTTLIEKIYLGGVAFCLQPKTSLTVNPLPPVREGMIPSATSLEDAIALTKNALSDDSWIAEFNQRRDEYLGTATNAVEKIIQLTYQLLR
ncbi:hypothetical protein C4573_01595 [Candidatus Woesearchaeota archaeon]|nr:MAG: hypothetical protein C4573_01595 [Candidatus Woesearchaeota archaeon]